jgi:hypothetical protein
MKANYIAIGASGSGLNVMVTLQVQHSPPSVLALSPEVLQSYISSPGYISLRAIHSGPRFEDAQEGRYFRIYVEEMATQIKGPFSTSLWERLIPQPSEANHLYGMLLSQLAP